MIKIFSVWRIGYAFVKANVISNQYLCQIFIMALTLQDIRNALFSIINFLYFIVYCRIIHNFCLQYRHMFTEFLIFLCLTNWVLTISDIYIKFLSFLVICHFMQHVYIDLYVLNFSYFMSDSLLDLLNLTPLWQLWYSY